MLSRCSFTSTCRLRRAPITISYPIRVSPTPHENPPPTITQLTVTMLLSINRHPSSYAQIGRLSFHHTFKIKKISNKALSFCFNSKKDISFKNFQMGLKFFNKFSIKSMVQNHRISWAKKHIPYRYRLRLLVLLSCGGVKFF